MGVLEREQDGWRNRRGTTKTKRSTYDLKVQTHAGEIKKEAEERRNQ